MKIQGKFLFDGDEKFFVRGVTYGAFRPDENKNEYHDLAVIERDFAQMAASGINTVRIPHTMPPRVLLDVAAKHGLKVMVGLSAEQYAGFLIDTAGAPDIVGEIRTKVRTCAGHPALLCYALGNEIPAQLVRWIGPARIERYLRELFDAVKAEDPSGLVTYVNYPSTEYLQLPFLDLLSFNVYLESRDRLEAYLARLHCLAGDRPVVMSEVGLDACRNGEDRQAGFRVATDLPLTRPEPEVVFEGQTFVFAGEMAYGPTHACEREVQERGGMCDRTVNRRTDFVVIGSLAADDWRQSAFGGLVDEVVQYRARGVPIAVITEDLWVAALP